jgi:hypothetical protein
MLTTFAALDFACGIAAFIIASRIRLAIFYTVCTE